MTTPVWTRERRWGACREGMMEDMFIQGPASRTDDVEPRAPDPLGIGSGVGGTTK